MRNKKLILLENNTSIKNIDLNNHSKTNKLLGRILKIKICDSFLCLLGNLQTKHIEEK